MRRFIFLALWLFFTLPATAGRAQGTLPQVLVLTAQGPLTQVMSDYIQRGLQTAEKNGAGLVVLRLDTPGGSIELMTQIVEMLRASPVPVVVYVAPRGAMAGSAGTLITLAGQAAAMAPETTIGAASPVGLQGQDLGQTMQAKVKSMLQATARTLAERRGPQAVKLADETIQNARAVSASEALQAGLVDYIAEDVPDLLAQMDGKAVATASGSQQLHTAGAEVQEISASPIEQTLAILTNPTIAFLLLIIGILAILIELSSPGGWVSGFIGVVCLALAAYGMGVLPVNWFGVVFLVAAFVLFILDIKAPTHGALTAAGVVSLIVGGLVLFNSPDMPPFQRVPVPLIIGMSAATGALFFVIMLYGVRAQKRPVLTGMESMAGRSGIARSPLAPTGIIQIGGERWTAELALGEPPIASGERVEVQGVQGLKLIVRKIR